METAVRTLCIGSSTEGRKRTRQTIQWDDLCLYELHATMVIEQWFSNEGAARGLIYLWREAHRIEIFMQWRYIYITG
ncbi:hypothetical protein MUK42_10662 [Musa troglodytarum]|uniref:Uncharacterized protein n=1 Tax=Musa troglodytarum TaxID=320322 RepID=A0A9E7EKJ7_9LILI|nr:hypothetical protein MUK42_10662 [Musa troglodytarum]